MILRGAAFGHWFAGIAVGTALILAPAVAQAAPDDLRAALGAGQFALRDWQPAGFSAPRLRAGEATTLHLASDEALRVVMRVIQDGQATEIPLSGALQFWVSDGQGLLARMTPRIEQGAYVLPASTDPRVIRIVRPATSRHAVSLDIATGRVHLDDAGLGYDRAVPLPGPSLRLTWDEPRHQTIRHLDGPTRQFGAARAGERRARDYTRLEAGQTVLIDVTGPQRLRLETRLLPEATEDFYRAYRIEWDLDGRPQKPLGFEASWDLSRSYRWKTGDAAGVTGAQTGYLNVPEGRHRLRLVPSRPMLLRADAFGGTLVAPAANAAPRLEEAFAAVTRATPPDRSDLAWGALGDPVPRIDLLGDAPGTIEARARDLARTSAVSGGGMKAAELLLAAASARPDLPGLAASSERFSQAFGFFRQLQPLGHTPRGMPLWDSPRTLDEPAITARPHPGPAVPATALLTGLRSALFHDLPRPGALTYQSSERTAVTRLRVMIDRAGLKAPVRLSLEADGHAPILLELVPDSQDAALPRHASFGDLGLARLAQDSGLPPGDVAIRVLRSRGLDEARRTDIATIDLTLDHPVSRLRLRAEGAPGGPLRVALAERVSRRSSLDAPAYIHLLAQLGQDPARHLFSHALQSAITCENWLRVPAACRVAPVGPAQIPQAEFYNDMRPLLRLLRSRERLVFDSVRYAPAMSDAGDAMPDPTRAQQLLTSADEWLSNGQPLLALEDFTRARASPVPAAAARALAGQVRALDTLGEAYLPDRILRHAALPCGDEPGAAARAQLLLRYRDRADFDRQIGVLARHLLCGDAGTSLETMTKLLAADRRDEAALKLGALIGISSTPDLAAARARTGWLGVPLPSVLDVTSSLDATALVIHAAGAIPVNVETRDLFTTMYRATEAHPVVIQTPQDGILELTLRPVIGTGLPGTGYATIDGAGPRATRTFPSSAESPNLTDLSGSGRFGAGETWRGAVRAGQTITIRATRTDLALEATLRPDAAIQADDTPEAQLSRVSQLAAEYRADPIGRPDLLVEAARLAAPLDGQLRAPVLRPFWAHVRRQSRWERIIRVSASAGVTEIETPGQPFDSPTLRTRAILAQGFDTDARIVTSDNELTLRRQGDNSLQVTARLALVPLPSIPVPEVMIRVTDPQGTVQTLRLGPDARSRPVTFDFPPGFTTYALRLEAPVPNAFVQLRIDRSAEDMQMVLPENRTRQFEVATAEEPLVYLPSSPVVLRVDEWRDGRLLSRMVLAGADAPVMLRPTDSRQRALFRLFELVPDPAPTDTDDPPEVESSERIPYADSAVSGLSVLVRTMPQTLSFPEAVVGARTAELVPGHPGTWSFRGGLSRTSPTQDRRSDRLSHFETSVRYRRYHPGWDAYSDLTGRLRLRDAGPAMYGLDGRMEWPSRLYNTSYSAGFDLRLQGFDRLAWRLALDFGAERDFVLNDTLDLKLDASLSFSTMSHESAPSADADEIEPSVYSAYLRDHGSALRMGAQLDWRPYEDLRMFARVEQRSNAFDEGLSIDTARVQFGLRHYRGGLRTALTASRSFFLKDRDRAESSNRTEIALDAVWEAHRDPKGRLEVGGGLNYRSDLNDLGGELFLTWHMGGGFEDMSPDSVEFRSLRENARYRWLEDRYGQ